MPNQGKGSEKKFLGGVAVLLPATLFAKILGLFYKIPLVHTVGVTGMAYFLSAYHVYSLLFVLSASGLPTALSLLISKAVASGEGRSAGRILRLSLFFFLLLGGAGALVLLCGADFLAARLSMPEAAPALRAIAPALVLSVVTGALRGWFQGQHNMIPTAVSEVLEALGKLCFGLLFAGLAKGRGASLSEVAAAAIFGITAGVALSALWLLLATLLFPRGREGGWCRIRRRQALSSLCRVALPVTMGAVVMNLVSLIDTVLISGRLQAGGMAPEVANAMYSSYGNLAVPFYNLIPALLAPVTLALTPALSAAMAERKREEAGRIFGSALRVGALVTLPAALGLSVFARPLLLMLYRGEESAVSVAAPLLSILCASMIPAVLISLTGAALQAAGHTMVPFFSMLAGAAFKLAVEVILLGVPGVGIGGAPISTLCCNLMVLTVQVLALSRVMPPTAVLGREPLRALGAAVFAVGGGVFLYSLLEKYGGAPGWHMPVTLLLVMLLYMLLALRWRAVQQEDIRSLPMGERLCLLLQKCKLLPEVKK